MRQLSTTDRESEIMPSLPEEDAVPLLPEHGEQGRGRVQAFGKELEPVRVAGPLDERVRLPERRLELVILIG